MIPNWATWIGREKADISRREKYRKLLEESETRVADGKWVAEVRAQSENRPPTPLPKGWIEEDHGRQS